MSLFVPIERFENFKAVKDYPLSEIPRKNLLKLLQTIQKLDERNELEPFLRVILSDSSATPHGPAELVDILTNLSADGQSGLAALILKGKSFLTVRPVDVSHQIYRLKKLSGLKFAIFGAVGTILDAAKEQFCATCSEIPCCYSICNAEDFVRIFLAYGFICPHDANLISSGRCHCGYSPPKRVLNILQRDALEELKQTHLNGRNTGLIVLPPGSGKTRIAAEDALCSNADSILFVAHTNEILDVAESEFQAKFGIQNVQRIESHKSFSIKSKVNLATIQLLTKHLPLLFKGQFDYLIIDEFHHAAARSYRTLIDKIRPDFLLGLTATPYRGDQQNILQLCENTIVVDRALRFGIETGVLCPYHYYGCFDDIDYSQISHNGTSYGVRDLEKALIIPERDQAIIRKWREKAEFKQTLAFCCSIKHAERVAESFNSQKISAFVYSSKLPRNQRLNVINKFKAGNISVLCVIDVLNEGADLPFVDCLLFLRPTESKRIFFQQLGRGLRRYFGKTHCTVIDFIGNFKNANRSLDYQDLKPFDELYPEESTGSLMRKDIFNLPPGCKVDFEDRVLDIFFDQTNDPNYATRHNIGRILIYQYDRLARRLGKSPTKADIDRNLVINSPIYSTFFGGWKAFEDAMARRHREEISRERI
jgi:superfamily II DNA or RNA helicase